MFPVHKINVVDNPGPAFGSIEYAPTKPISDKKYYDNLNYDEEVNRLLDEVEDELLGDKSESYDSLKNTGESSSDESESDDEENYDFPEDTHHVGSIPDWYREMLENKIKKAKARLENLSELVCANSPSTAAHIKRIEADHSTTFCKMDYPKHPPMHKSWKSFWELCLRLDDPNVSQHDYPMHVIRAAKVLRRFAKKLNKKISKSKREKKSEGQDKSECKGNVDVLDDDWWRTMRIVLISNHLNELMIVIRRDGINNLVFDLKSYFELAIRKNPNIVSVFSFDSNMVILKQKRQKTRVVKKDYIAKNLHIAGARELRDKVGPLSIRYDLANHRTFFDSVETRQLGKVIQDYMCLTKETTLLDINCFFGVMTLLMSYKCEKVIGLNREERAKWLSDESEKLRIANNIENVSFLKYKAGDIFTVCEPLIEQCITVAILKLKERPEYKRRLKDILKALRNLPTIWRVILYGAFHDDVHESIEVLTSEDDSLGERYLPMQGCIVDKSPTIVDDFDLVILFERKSLIAPKVELFAPGPTVNVAVDSETSDNSLLDAREVKSELLMDGDQKIGKLKGTSGKRVPPPTVTEKKSQPAAINQAVPLLSVRKEFQCVSSSPCTKTLQDGKHVQPMNDQLVATLSEKVEFRFDRPPPPLGTFPPFSYPPPPENKNFQFNIPPPPLQTVPPFHPNPTREDFQNDYPPSLLELRFANPNFQSDPYQLMKEDLPFNYPLPTLESYSSAPILQGPYQPNDFQHSLPPENYYNPPHFPNSFLVLSNEFQNHYQPPPPPVPSVSTKDNKASKKNKLHFYPPPPPVRYPSPPPPPPLPPPEEIDLLDEASSASSSSKIVTDEPMELCDDEEEVSETINAAEDVISSVEVKSEPIRSSYSVDISEAYCHSPTTTVNDKLIQVREEKISKVINTLEDVIPSVSIKLEPVDSSYSADLSDDDGTFLEGTRYSSMESVKVEPSLHDKEKEESNVVDCVPNVKAEPLQNESQKESNAADFGTNVKAEPLQDREKNVEDCVTTVKAEPLQDKDKNEQNVADCETSVEAESLQDEDKIETNTADSGITLKVEPSQDEEKNDSNIADSKASIVPIKSEPMDQSSSVSFSEVSCQNTVLPVTTKSEPTAFSPITSPDCESTDMQISPSPTDFQSMETPIHNPRALSDITPVKVSKNVSVSGSEFSVQTNQSFLSNDKPKVAVDVDKEPGEISDSDEENEKISEGKNKQKEKSKSIEVLKKPVSTIPSRKLVRPPRPFPGKYSEASSSREKRHRRRSPSPKRLKTSPTSESRHRRRSPVSDERRRERSKRSPLRDRAKSPRHRGNRRSRSRSPRRR